MERPLRYPQILFCFFVYAVLVSKASGADPQPYQVMIEPTVSSDIDALLRTTSFLGTRGETAPVPPFGLVARATGDVQRLASVLNSFGYYRPIISITIEGRALDDPILPSFLDQVPQGTAVNVKIGIE